MPTFKNEAEIKAYILKKSRRAVQVASEKVYRIIEDFIIQYYNDYTPEEYIRTYKLLQSLVKSNVVPDGSGFKAEVYFDASALQYKKGQIELQHTPEHGRYGYATWGATEVLGTALHGSHGGYIRTAPIYGQSVNKLNAEAIEILKNQLIAAGIPVT